MREERVLLTIVLDGLGFEHVLVLRSAVCVDDNVWINDLTCLLPPGGLGRVCPLITCCEEGERERERERGRERGREGEREGGRERGREGGRGREGE